MTERAGILKKYTQNFFLDEAKLRKIDSVLREHASKLKEKTFLTYYIERENDSFYETHDIEEVLKDDNSPGAAITALVMKVHKTDSGDDQPRKPQSEKKPIASVEFFPLKDSKVGFSVTEKERGWCFLLADEIEAQIKRVFTPGTFLFLRRRIFDLIIFFSFAMVAMWWGIKVIRHTLPRFTPQEIASMSLEGRTQKILELLTRQVSMFDWLLPLSWFVMVLVMVMPLLRPFSRLVEKLRRPVFYWGDMMQVHDRFERKSQRIKWGIVVALAVTIVGGLIVGLILK